MTALHKVLLSCKQTRNYKSSKATGRNKKLQTGNYKQEIIRVQNNRQNAGQEATYTIITILLSILLLLLISTLPRLCF